MAVEAPVYLTCAEAGRRLGLQRHAVWNAAERGTLAVAAWAWTAPLFTEAEVGRYQRENAGNHGRKRTRPIGPTRRQGRPATGTTQRGHDAICPACRWRTRRTEKPGRGLGVCGRCKTPLTRTGGNA